MARISVKKGINVRRVVSKVAVTIIVLYAGGTVLNELGSVMNCTSSPFYDGLSLIGWTVSDNFASGTHGCLSSGIVNGTNNVITNTTGSGILTVVGIIAIASIVLEFVQIQL